MRSAFWRICVSCWLVFLPTVATAATTWQAELERAQKFLKERQYSEVIEQIESLQAEEEFEQAGRTSAELLLSKAKAYSHLYRFEEALNYYTLASQWAARAGWSDIEIYGLGAQAGLLIHMHKHEKAQDVIRKSLALEIPDSLLNYRSNSFTSLADIYKNQNKPDSAVIFYNQALAIDFARQDSSSLPFNLLGKALALRMQGNAQEALELTLQGYGYLRKGRDDFKKAAFSAEMSALFLSLDNAYKALQYGKESVQLSNQLGLKKARSYAHLVLAKAYQSLDSLELAKQHADSATVLHNLRKRNDGLLESISVSALIHLSEGDLIRGKEKLSHADMLLAKAELSNSRLWYWYAKARYEKQSAQWVLLRNTLNDMYAEDAYPQNQYLKIQAFGLESSLAEAMGDEKTALHFTQRQRALEKSLAKNRQANLVHEMDALFQQTKREKELNEAKHQQNLQSLVIHQKNKVINYGLIALGIVVLLGVFLLVQYQIIKRSRKAILSQNEIVKDALQDKELLLREIHHRVKNNLQVVSSLLSIQSRNIEDKKALEAVTESRNRVKSMALLHQDLYSEENLMGIEAKHYIEKLSRSLSSSYKAQKSSVELYTDIDDLLLDIDTGVPLGLIINELVTNCFKYAFPEGMEGRIEIALKEVDDVLQLTVKDNGIGSEEGAYEASNSFGLKMIKAFASKLDAQWQIVNQGGTTVSLLIRNYKVV